jgi:hypothetical protein
LSIFLVPMAKLAFLLGLIVGLLIFIALMYRGDEGK